MNKKISGAKNYATINRKRFKTVMVDGVQRFPVNRIVRTLLDRAKEGKKYDLNEIMSRYCMGEFSKDEMHEFYRLIGYSVCGFSEVFDEDSVSSPVWKK